MDDFDDPIISTDIVLDGLLQKSFKLKCAYCKRSTNHKVIKSVEDTWDSDFGLAGKQDHMIVQCMGCDRISYCIQSSDNETFTEIKNADGTYKTEYTVTTEQYPVASIVFDSPKYISSMPKEVTSVYHETHKALVNGLDKLGGAGIRMTVEMVCLDNDISKGTLSQKIEELCEKGIVNSKMKDLLHNVRLFGNKQVHKSETPDYYILVEAWNAVNNFLVSTYGTKTTNERFNSYNKN